MVVPDLHGCKGGDSCLPCHLKCLGLENCHIMFSFALILPFVCEQNVFIIRFGDIIVWTTQIWGILKDVGKRESLIAVNSEVKVASEMTKPYDPFKVLTARKFFPP